jgi:hypothetical protein
MRRGKKVLAIVALSFAFVVLGCGLLLAATGVGSVRVQEKKADGARFFVPVPAVALYAGAALLPRVMPAAERARMREELGDRRQAIVAILEELERCPDGVLVDVEEHGETVRIVKEGRSLAVRVRSADADVDVSLPAGAVTHLFQALTA